MEERKKDQKFNKLISYFGKTDLHRQNRILVKKISLIKGAAFLQKLKSAGRFCLPYSLQKLSKDDKLCRKAARTQPCATHTTVTPFKMRDLVSIKFHSHLLAPRNDTNKM